MLRNKLNIVFKNTSSLFKADYSHLVSKTRHTNVGVKPTPTLWQKSSSKMSLNQNLSHQIQIAPQNYDYFLVLDFEATCDKPTTPKPQEIIEFPVLKVNAKTFDVESTFHTYVQPKIHKELSAFCIELTGIIQDQVDDEPYLEEVLEKFDNWLKNEKLLDPEIRKIFVTCGEWDLITMLPTQCNYFNITMPKYFHKWINIKKSYAAVTGSWPKGLTVMSTGLSLPHIGRLHSGIDDCRNIAAIMKCLAMRGHIFYETSTLN